MQNTSFIIDVYLKTGYDLYPSDFRYNNTRFFMRDKINGEARKLLC